MIAALELRSDEIRQIVGYEIDLPKALLSEVVIKTSVGGDDAAYVLVGKRKVCDKPRHAKDVPLIGRHDVAFPIR